MGCSSISVVGYPIENGKHRVQRTVSDPHAWAPTTQRSWMETCDATPISAKPKENGFEQEYNYHHCVTEGQVQFSTNSGYMDGFGKSVVQTGAILGAAAILADGIRDSGSVTNQTGGGATQSQQQGQHQGQQQQQGQIGINGGKKY
jgi:hypothetical protein